VPEPGGNALDDRRQFVVILRLVAATTGRLLYGEVIDVDMGPTGRFAGWRGMTKAVRNWLADEMTDLPEPAPRPVDDEPESHVEH
jgi:hypothetical protein